MTGRLLDTLCVAIFVCSGVGMLPGCEQQRITETESFEQAEVAYREGRYRSALDDYEQFLRHYPRSPLAKIAALRIKTINREVQSMLGRTATPPPLYIGEGQDAIKKTTSLKK